MATESRRSRSPIDFEDVTRPTGITTSLDVRTAALVDLDDDGDTDSSCSAALPVTAGRQRHLLRGATTAMGRLPTSRPAPCPRRRRSSRAPSIATDVDLRRDIDLLVLGEDGRIRLWCNMRDASFRDVSADVGLVALPAVLAIAVGDLTKDGFPIAVSARTGSSVLAVGASNNRFASRPLDALPAGALAAQMADADNDGLLDIVAVTAGGIRAVRQAAGGLFEAATAITGGAAMGRAVDGPTRAVLDASLVLLDAYCSGSIDVVTLRDGATTLHAARGAARCRPCA